MVNTRTFVSLFSPRPAFFLRQREGDNLVIGDHRAGLGAAGIRCRYILAPLSPFVSGRCGRDRGLQFHLPQFLTGLWGGSAEAEIIRSPDKSQAASRKDGAA